MCEIDVRLLSVFAETYKRNSVTQAAEELGLSQSTISFNLSKLREHFRDPLFVRTPRGMEATPFAIDLYEHVVDVLASFRKLTSFQTTFDPMSEARTFRIAMTDISQMVMLPTLLNKLRTTAPNARVQISHISAETPQLLAKGELELAVGFMPQLEAGFYQQKFFAQRYVVLASSNRGRRGAGMTLKSYLDAEHIAVTASGTGHSIVDRVLRERQLGRRIVLELPNYLGLAGLVAQTDLLATVPEKLGDLLSPSLPVVRFPAPFDAPNFDVKQHWHERTHHDAAHRWLRNLLAELFLDRGETNPSIGASSAAVVSSC
ncbi:DNA-binding transcriptional LysR family regulator [Paraburkholderia sp. RAU2J]|uniref:LysR family transcriptional regulator n=1 Tax=Paraburkholderia sp. RAU2J TaxID=1938810 RepID=UPI000EB54895|nr:LysR family transcriptional regulator [Paraburkholderia sp. RAU2J]RKT20344.1 DNA-binding transcriptional LysR family regulator [Paraburkholderia sp. RAU2J]